MTATLTNEKSTESWTATITQADLERYILAGLNADLGRAPGNELELPLGGDDGDDYWFAIPAYNGPTGFSAAAPMTGDVTITSSDVTPA